MLEPYIEISDKVARGGKFVKEYNFLLWRITKCEPKRENKDSFAATFFYPNNMGKVVQIKPRRIICCYGFRGHNYYIGRR